MGEQFLVDLDLIRHPQAVGYFDDVDPVEECLVVLVVLERLPFRFVGMRQDHPFKGDGRQTFGTVVITFLSSSQQRMQHLDWCFEHFHEFHQPSVGAAQRTGEAVGIRVILGEMFQLADVNFAHQ